MTRWFEEIPLGHQFDLGDHTFSEDEIVRFGSAYDPQYFHTDAKDARHSHFGGLVASGWHTVCVGHRLMVDALFAEEERLRALGKEPGVSGPSPGVNIMDFRAPVRPGDTITYTLIVKNKRHSNSLPGWGLLFNHISGINQHGEQVYEADLVGFSKLRDFRPSIKMRLQEWAIKRPLLRKLLSR